MINNTTQTPVNSKTKSNLPKLSKSKNKTNVNCITRYTRWNISGWKDNELKYFDLHPVSCPKNSLLRFIKLELDKKLNKKPTDTADVTRMRFKYSCCKTKAYSCLWFKSKPIKSGNAYRLRKIVPKCKCDKVLKSFRFITKFKQPGYRNPKTHVKYQCCSFYTNELKSYKKIKMSTQWRDSGNGRTKYLSNHRIKCENDSFISTFKLVLHDKDIKNNPSYRFNYSCIRPSFTELVKISKPVTKINKIPVKSIIYKQPENQIIDPGYLAQENIETQKIGSKPKQTRPSQTIKRRSNRVIAGKRITRPVQTERSELSSQSKISLIIPQV